MLFAGCFSLICGLGCAAVTFVVAGLYFAAKGGQEVAALPDTTKAHKQSRGLALVAIIGFIAVLCLIETNRQTKTTQENATSNAAPQTEKPNNPADVEAQAAAEFEREFFQKYPDLKPYRAVVDAVASRLQVSGFKASREATMEAFAKGAREEIARQQGATPTHADQPNAVMLGLRYENGDGVRQDYVEAYKWYSFAAAQGDAEATTAQARIYPKGVVAFENEFYAGYPDLKAYAAVVNWAASQTAASGLQGTKEQLMEAFAKAAREEINRLSARINDIIAQEEREVATPAMPPKYPHGLPRIGGLDWDAIARQNIDAQRASPEWQLGRKREIVAIGDERIQQALQTETAKHVSAGNQTGLGQAALSDLKAGAESAASSQLGLRYENGDGVEQDYAKAASWYLIAAQRGDALAQNNLGVMYETGRGVPKDCNAAYKWYLQAAKNGNLAAQYNLGLLFRDGRGVQQDTLQAYAMFCIAAEGGYTNAVPYRDSLAQSLTPQQVDSARQRVGLFKALMPH